MIVTVHTLAMINGRYEIEGHETRTFLVTAMTVKGGMEAPLITYATSKFSSPFRIHTKLATRSWK